MLLRVVLVWLFTSPTVFAETLTYDVTFNGLRFGVMNLDLEQENDRYKIVAKAHAKGFLGMILRSRYEGRAEGSIGVEHLIPESFYVKSDRVFRHRLTEITFKDARPVAVNLTPVKDHTTLTNPALVVDRRIDSLSGLFRLFTANPNTCPGPLPLYDGRRLLSVTLARTNDAPFICKGHYRIDRGPDHSIQKGQREFDLVFTYDPKGGAPRSVEVISGGSVVRLERQ